MVHGHILYSFCTVINAVNYHCIIHIYYLEKTWKNTNHIVFMFHQLSFMLVIQLSGGMPVKSYYYFSMSPFWTFCARAPSGFENEMKHTARGSVQRSMMFTSFRIRIKTHPKRRYYIFSFNLKLYLLTLALENLYFSTLDREKCRGRV